MSKSGFDVCIRGAGIVGQTLALRLGQAKLRVALVDGAPADGPAQRARDVRAYALNQASRQLLQELRCWPEGDAVTAVRHMHVRGDAGGAVRFDAPHSRAIKQQPGQTTATAADALAWIVDVPALEDVLRTALRFQPGVELVSDAVPATLTAICEGKASTSRAELGVEFDHFDYPQHAVATRLRSSQPHGGTAHQWFCGEHILALLPLGGAQGDEYAVVWSTSVAQAQRLVALDEATFVAELHAIATGAAAAGPTPHGQGLPPHTQFTLSAPRARWPLRLAQARQWAGPMPSAPDAAWVLLGDAAHTVHPLAGSGLNLGLGDVAALADALLQRPAWRSVADQRLLRQYARQRKAALLPMATATDGLQWLFWQQQPWLQGLRNWGMRGFSASGPLKHWVMQQAMGGTAALPMPPGLGTAHTPLQPPRP
ncbi:FAD-dependent monooxygenase [Vandammella animalimorsus]|uniref:Ubiquinone biosynthesis protein UbiH n=1 Tax=Vandammella animalimorsus TaxID=2029117 RepID=A0A2A2A9C6_9BURK|nr:FAD-dependent monooxygenase [Vandammella animalimorsus]PAT34179.1 ubiquinone biosynthesis protein UbiH [Vandammella animalimorsus]